MSTARAIAPSSEGREGEPQTAEPEAREPGEVTLAVGDNGVITLICRGATRREALNRLLAERAVEIEWRDTAFAEGRVHGRWSGLENELVRRLLARSNYVVVHDSSRPVRRVSRITVLGSDQPKVTNTTAPAPRHQTTPQKPQSGEMAVAKQRRLPTEIVPRVQRVRASTRQLQ